MEERTTKIINDRPDSVEIGTPSKGGCVKVYFNAAGKQEENNAILEEGMRMKKEMQTKHEGSNAYL